MEKLDIKNWWVNIKNWRIWEKLGLCTLMQSWKKDYTEIELIDMCIELVKNRKENKIKLRKGPEIPGFERNDKYGYGDFICTSAWGKRLFWIGPHKQLVINMDGPNDYLDGFELVIGRGIYFFVHEEGSADQELQKLKELYELCEGTHRAMFWKDYKKYWARRDKWDRLLNQISFNVAVRNIRQYMQK